VLRKSETSKKGGCDKRGWFTLGQRGERGGNRKGRLILLRIVAVTAKNRLHEEECSQKGLSVELKEKGETSLRHARVSGNGGLKGGGGGSNSVERGKGRRL